MKRRSRVILICCVTIAALFWTTRHHLARQLFGFPGPPQDIPLAPAVEQVMLFGFDGAAQSNGVPAPWESRVIRGKLEVSVDRDPELADQPILRLKSDRSHFLVWNPAQPFDPKEYPIIRWSWKCLSLPTNGDIRTHREFMFSSANRNDKTLQVLVGFEGENVLSYVWDASAPVGTEVEEWSPVATIRTRVVESGADNLNKWQKYEINIYEDYQRRFGKPPTKVLGVSVQTNSNHTGSVVEGLVSQITAHKK